MQFWKVKMFISKDNSSKHYFEKKILFNGSLINMLIDYTSKELFSSKNLGFNYPLK